MAASRGANFLCKLKGQEESESNLPSKIYMQPLYTKRKAYMRQIMTRSMVRTFQSPTTVIQRAWRRFQGRKGRVDPITMGPLEPPVFTCVGETGHEHHFSAVPLAEFVRESGDFRNPITRVEFNEIEVRRLVRLTGMEEILDVEERKRQRMERLQRESLRGFFESEITNAIDSFIEYVECNPMNHHSGFLVRHMLTLVFPTIIVTIARCSRTDREYVEQLFEIIDGRREMLREALRHHPSHRTVPVLFSQFTEDIRRQAMNSMLENGQTASIDLNGMAIRIDLEHI